MITSPEMGQVQRAYREGVSLMVRMGGRLVLYEPGLPASGMTLFGEDGFVLGPEALVSQAELIQTCLHELYRLSTYSAWPSVRGWTLRAFSNKSISARGASG